MSLIYVKDETHGPGIRGNTYYVRNDLIKCGGSWNPEKKVFFLKEGANLNFSRRRGSLRKRQKMKCGQ